MKRQAFEEETYRVIVKANEVVLNFLAESRKELIEKLKFISRSLVIPNMPVKKDKNGYDIDDEEYKRGIIVSVIENDLTAIIFPICDLTHWYKN